MRPVYLIKHASPQVQPNVPAESWQLSTTGVAEARQLATLARRWGIKSVYSSIEPKAQSTALLIGDELAHPVRVVDGLQEIRVGWIANSDEFSEHIRQILEHPSVPLRGAETAEDAAARFALAMQIVEQGELPAAVVAHGRVLTAYLTHLLGIDDPFAFWRAIPMPAWACLDLDGPRLISGFVGLAPDPPRAT